MGWPAEGDGQRRAKMEDQTDLPVPAHGKRRKVILFFLVCSLALVCVSIGQLAPTPVRADVGIQPVLPGGSSIKPGEETPIQMADETVVMTVRAATEADNALVT